MLFVTEDTIKFCILEKKNDEAKAHIRKMYKYATSDAEAEKYLEVLAGSIGNNSSDLTLCDGVSNPRYRIATWINISYMIFHEMTGINVINMYSNTMFKDMAKGGASFTPRQGTYLCGAIQVFATILST